MRSPRSPSRSRGSLDSDAAGGSPRFASKVARESFQGRVQRIVRAIPKGQVLSYGKVALLAGKPGAARAVVRALHGLSGAPWWRVIRSDGTVAREMAPRQAQKLRADGLRIRGLRVLARGSRH